MTKGLRAGRLFMAIVALVAVVASQADAVAGQKMVLQLGHPEAEVEKGIHHFIAMQFRDRIAEYTDGRVEVQIFGNNQLGAERDLLEGMQMGSVDMASTANLIVGNFRAEYKVFDLPYMFKDAESAYKVLDSDYIEQLNGNSPRSRASASSPSAAGASATWSAMSAKSGKSPISTA